MYHNELTGGNTNDKTVTSVATAGRSRVGVSTNTVEGGLGAAYAHSIQQHFGELPIVCQHRCARYRGLTNRSVQAIHDLIKKLICLL